MIAYFLKYFIIIYIYNVYIINVYKLTKEIDVELYKYVNQLLSYLTG